MNANLFWTIVWGILFIVSLIGIFWNRGQVFMAAVTATMCVAFLVSYLNDRKFNK